MKASVLPEDIFRNAVGQLHRVDGPAVDYPGEYTAWYFNGLRHCTVGPAIIVGDHKEWWLRGKRYEPTEWMIKVYELKSK